MNGNNHWQEEGDVILRITYEGPLDYLAAAAIASALAQAVFAQGPLALSNQQLQMLANRMGGQDVGRIGNG